MIDTDAIRAYLAGSTDTAEATAHIAGLALTAPALRTLAADLGVCVPSRASKAETLRKIVHWRVAVRLNSQTLRRSRYDAR